MNPDEDRKSRGCAYPRKRTPAWEARQKNRENRLRNRNKV